MAVYSVTLACVNQLLHWYYTDLYVGSIFSELYMYTVQVIYSYYVSVATTVITLLVYAHNDHTACMLVKGKLTAAYLMKFNLSLIIRNCM